MTRFQSVLNRVLSPPLPPKAISSIALVFAALLVASPSSAQPRYFTVRAVDATSRAPIAGVVLHTTSRVTVRTDVNGNAAFYEPGLMNRDVWFSYERPGYDGPEVFGLRGLRLRTTEGATGELALRSTTDPDPGAPGATDAETRLARTLAADRAHRFPVSSPSVGTTPPAPTAVSSSPPTRPRSSTRIPRAARTRR